MNFRKIVLKGEREDKKCIAYEKPNRIKNKPTGKTIHIHKTNEKGKKNPKNNNISKKRYRMKRLEKSRERQVMMQKKALVTNTNYIHTRTHIFFFRIYKLVRKSECGGMKWRARRLSKAR